MSNTKNHMMLRTRTKSQQRLRQIAKRQRWTLVEAFDVAVETLDAAVRPNAVTKKKQEAATA